jgi:hypothetical protein
LRRTAARIVQVLAIATCLGVIVHFAYNAHQNSACQVAG